MAARHSQRPNNVTQVSIFGPMQLVPTIRQLRLPDRAFEKTIRVYKVINV